MMRSPVLPQDYGRPNRALALQLINGGPSRPAEVQPRVITLHGGVGHEFAEAGGFISARDVATRLRADRHRPVLLHLDSGGGSVAEAQRIAAEIQDHRGPVSALVPVRCHSAAGLVLVAAQRRAAHPKAKFLLHGAAFDRAGIMPRRLDARRLRLLAEEAEEATEKLVAAYAERCTAPAWRFRMMLASEQTVGPWEARMLGLIHDIEGVPLAPMVPRWPMPSTAQPASH